MNTTIYLQYTGEFFETIGDRSYTKGEYLTMESVGAAIAFCREHKDWEAVLPSNLQEQRLQVRPLLNVKTKLDWVVGNILQLESQLNPRLTVPCPLCGALVPVSLRGRHEEWHSNLILRVNGVTP